MIEITKIEGFGHVTGRLSHLPHIIEKATVSGLNKIAAKSRTAASRGIREKYNIKARDVKSGVTLTRAKAGTKKSDGRLFAVITAKGGSFPLMKFAARPTEPAPQKGIPVKRRTPTTVKVLKKGSRKRVAHGFVVQRKSGHVGVFRREGTASLPITEALAPGVAKMFEKQGIAAAKKIATTEGRRIMEHEIDYYIKKEAGMMPARGKR